MILLPIFVKLLFFQVHIFVLNFIVFILWILFSVYVFSEHVNM